MRYAFAQARRDRGQIVAVHVVLTSSMTTSFDLALVEALHGNNAALRSQVEDLAETYDVAALFVSRIGDAASVLIQAARDYLADAIVLGASKQLVHRIVGSAPIAVVRRAPCPVIVVP